MKVNDRVYLMVEQPKGNPKRCLAVIKEIHGPVARLSVNTGKAIVSKNARLKDLKPEESES